MEIEIARFAAKESAKTTSRPSRSVGAKPRVGSRSVILHRVFDLKLRGYI